MWRRARVRVLTKTSCESLADLQLRGIAHGRRDGPYLNQFRHPTIKSEFEKSIKTAPTTGTTRYEIGAGPYRFTTESMPATAFAVIPIMNPKKPPAATAAS